MKRFLISLVICIAVAWNAHAVGNEERAVNLIVNGSFERGPKMELDSFLPLNEDDVAIQGWVVTRGQIDLYNGGWQTADGLRSLDLHGSPGFGGVKQPFVTKAGQTYRVSFSMSGHPGRGHQQVQMCVRAAGQKEIFQCDMAGKDDSNMRWEKKVWEFTATDNITILEFHTAMAVTTDAFGGPTLDNIKVIAIRSIIDQ